MFDAIVAWAGGCGGRLLTLDGAARLPGAVEVLPPDRFADASDVVIAAGGDGTVLHALAVAAPARVPVLGVNLGRLGFLAELDPPELPRALAAINADEFTVEERLALDVEMTSSDVTARFRASNDVVLGRIPGRGQAEFAVSVDGELFAALRRRRPHRRDADRRDGVQLVGRRSDRLALDRGDAPHRARAARRLQPHAGGRHDRTAHDRRPRRQRPGRRRMRRRALQPTPDPAPASRCPGATSPVCSSVWAGRASTHAPGASCGSPIRRR